VTARWTRTPALLRHPDPRGRGGLHEGQSIFNLEDVGPCRPSGSSGTRRSPSLQRFKRLLDDFRPHQRYKRPFHASLLPHLRLDKVQPALFLRVRPSVPPVPDRAKSGGRSDESVYSGEPSSLKIRTRCSLSSSTTPEFDEAVLLRLSPARLLAGLRSSWWWGWVLVAGGGSLGSMNGSPKSRSTSLPARARSCSRCCRSSLAPGSSFRSSNYDVQRVPGVAIPSELPRLSGPYGARFRIPRRVARPAALRPVPRASALGQ